MQAFLCRHPNTIGLLSGRQVTHEDGSPELRTGVKCKIGAQGSPEPLYCYASDLESGQEAHKREEKPETSRRIQNQRTEYHTLRQLQRFSRTLNSEEFHPTHKARICRESPP
jgi:hypothetical protein